ncbi:hypothetical protein BDZ97DRAFT_1844052 [Flammula alnicola]|nr:hypothetical protein BDZ97DRAFT_1844052 [Flammula alnicola]
MSSLTYSQWTNRLRCLLLLCSLGHRALRPTNEENIWMSDSERTCMQFLSHSMPYTIQQWMFTDYILLLSLPS